MTIFDHFDRAAQSVANAVAHPLAFLAALLTVLTWACVGPFVHYSETWQLIINTGTTIVTFLLMFVLQATQTRDTKALQLKLDELVLAIPSASNSVRHAEERTAAELDAIRLDR